MEIAPLQNTRYDIYEPEKYGCIKVHDDHIESLLHQLKTVDTYWHTLERPEKGLAYYGTTIISPGSLAAFLSVFEKQNNTVYEPLILLIKQAICNQKYIIHFGI